MYSLNKKIFLRSETPEEKNIDFTSPPAQKAFPSPLSKTLLILLLYCHSLSLEKNNSAISRSKAFNKSNNITPLSIKKNIEEILETTTEQDHVTVELENAKELVGNDLTKHIKNLDNNAKNSNILIETIKDIEITNNSQGKPSIFLKGDLAAYLKKKVKYKKYDIHLSLSDDKPWAQATVIISYNK